MAASIRLEMKIYKGTYMREQRLAEMIEQKVMEVKQVCIENETSDECKVAWDEVEEVSQAKSDLASKFINCKRVHLNISARRIQKSMSVCVYED